jgi:putative endonuclease
MYYIYVLASLKDGEWYTGAASDLKARLSQHERGEVSSTRFRRPWQLIYYQACREAPDAYRRERYLKTGRGKRYLRQRLKTWRMHLASDGSECPILGLPLLPEYSERPEKSWNGTSLADCRPGSRPLGRRRISQQARLLVV